MPGPNFDEFEKIVFQYMDELYTHAIYLTSSMEKAESVIQKTFENAYNQFQTEQVFDYKEWLLDILNATNEQCLQPV
mgnify:CR=1 FL=1